MGRRKFIDKKNAQNFQLVYRAQNDPRIHDVDASDMVFAEVAAPNTHKGGAHKIRTRHDLEEQLSDAGSGAVRRNEGEAANYGIYYDDSQYDYMQHMRDLGASSGATWVPARSKEPEKGKAKFRLEDALRGMSVGDDGQSEAGSMASTTSAAASDLFGEDMAPSEFVRRTTYQDQQDVPDAIAGFQPDMDPRLREVLEALEDDAYVEDEDDIFNALAEDGHEVDPSTWEALGDRGFDFDDDDEDAAGWETDDTIKPERETRGSPTSAGGAVEADSSNSTGNNDGGAALPAADAPVPDAHPATHGDGDWMAEFSKFKKDAKASKAAGGAKAVPSELQSYVTGASSLAGGRRKKRKGALTSTSNYSMTSSALFRTDQQSLLDERFDRIEEEYANDDYAADDNMSLASGMTGLSRASGISAYSSASKSGDAPALREDFDSILDEFSSAWMSSGKRGRKENGYKDGLAQLDAVRKGLGPARFSAKGAEGKGRAR
ncbi:uncharacterized protein K452DRAFT_269761 [Aplosporella prunicola CBS 121167]|uniref:Low temperature viability protein n=1 Tax=Aplosporella prunicola CBS 121167 TaxID=1176127 RepID=A0A6A6BFY1_9PEZI|nr:uncharacterized protein K452DRAFT_269761 [Aplosporella prunicola CBS 121167]KAF2143059.1 hypothetical protein K452DRAFT_269761 [Aplosporella prunicola CBS 121167]